MSMLDKAGASTGLLAATLWAQRGHASVEQPVDMVRPIGVVVFLVGCVAGIGLFVLLTHRASRQNTKK